MLWCQRVAEPAIGQLYGGQALPVLGVKGNTVVCIDVAVEKGRDFGREAERFIQRRPCEAEFEEIGKDGEVGARPGQITFASAGSGSASHLSGVLLKSATGIDILHVPYKGGGTAMPDVLSGQVSMMIETATGALSAIRSGKVRALAVTTAQRWPQLAIKFDY